MEPGGFSHFLIVTVMTWAQQMLRLQHKAVMFIVGSKVGKYSIVMTLG